MNIPLHILADKKRLPENQYLDEETILWIEQCGASNRYSENLDPVLRNYLAESYRVLKKHTPLRSSMFTRGAAALDSLHGDLHAYRVALFSGVLARLHTNDRLEPYVLAGLYHDISRINDKADHGHGVRSSEQTVNLRLLENNSDATGIIEAIARHEDDNVSTSDHPYLYILKTADALDRFRLPKQKWWPDTQRMPLTPTFDLLSLAYNLILATEKTALKNKDNADVLDAVVMDLIKESHEI